jgi:hypothetical protein
MEIQLPAVVLMLESSIGTECAYELEQDARRELKSGFLPLDEGELVEYRASVFQGLVEMSWTDGVVLLCARECTGMK